MAAADVIGPGDWGVSAGKRPPHTLLPVPESVVFRSGRLDLDGAFEVVVRGYSDERLLRAIGRAIARLGSQDGPSAAGLTDDASRAALVIECGGAGEAVQSVREDESYALDVTPERAVLRAPTVVGVIRGLETLLQLVEDDETGRFVRAVAVRDRPRFPWRGILVDVCRHFMPAEVLERTLDAMAAVKLNVLHLHLSEDQGFRVESRVFPRLHGMGSDGSYYTQDQVRRIVAFARDRGIRVVPEFDVPGHATSWFVGHPELASAPGPYTIERRFGIFDPVFDPTREETFAFLDGFVGEMTDLFPDACWHIGGDEVIYRQWDENAGIQAFMHGHGLRDNGALQAYLNRRIAAVLARHGRRMIGWDEILHPELPAGAIVQSWRGRESLYEAARRGFETILSWGYYLDHIQTAEFHYAVDPLPAGGGLSGEEEARILGGEACMWAEHVGPETIDSRLWPRAGAIAERLWSPRDVADPRDMYRRLGAASVRLAGLGPGHESHTDRMLARIAEPSAIEPLRELLDVVQPAHFWERAEIQKTTQLTPLTGLVDAARPDPWGRERVASLIAELLSCAGDRASHRTPSGASELVVDPAPPARDQVLMGESRGDATLSGDGGSIGEIESGAPPDSAGGPPTLDRGESPEVEAAELLREFTKWRRVAAELRILAAGSGSAPDARAAGGRVAESRAGDDVCAHQGDAEPDRVGLPSSPSPSQAVIDAAAAAGVLGELGEAGIEAIGVLTGRGKPPQGWWKRRMELLDCADLPFGLLRIAVAPAMRRLLEAAAGKRP